MKLFSTNKGSYLRSVVTGVLVGAVLAITFVSGFYFRELLDLPAPIAVSAGAPDADGYPLVDEVQTLLDRIYYREQPSYRERQYGAIRGLLAAYNEPNTFFIDPPVANSEADVLAGTYGGIGVLAQRNEAGEVILYPFEDSPAAAAGIIEGAVLVAINRQPVLLSDRADVIDQQMRGEVTEGNGVELTVRQNGEERTMFIEFAVINVPSVLWRVLEENNIGYVQLLRFTSRTPEELQTALRDLLAMDIEALVLDLRNNSGGLLEESVAVASEFLDGGVVIYQVTRDTEYVFEAEAGGLFTELPLVVLVNQHTASAAELVAGAIRDRERGILIGQRTFGKGTVQQIFVLSDGSSVHITSAEWFTPSRIPLAGLGLQPNIEMIPDENGRDVELGEAIRYLQEMLQERDNQ